MHYVHTVTGGRSDCVNIAATKSPLTDDGVGAGEGKPRFDFKFGYSVVGGLDVAQVADVARLGIEAAVVHLPGIIVSAGAWGLSVWTRSTSVIWQSSVFGCTMGNAVLRLAEELLLSHTERVQTHRRHTNVPSL